MDKISDYLSTSDLLCQLAEECSELAQAALKLKRAMEGTNPTPKSEPECWESLEEEMADVNLVMNEIVLARDELCIERLIDTENEKRERWLHRLRKNREELISRIRECKESEKEVAEAKKAVQESMFLKAELDMFNDWWAKAPQIREMYESYRKANQELMDENLRLKAEEKENRGIFAKVFGIYSDKTLRKEERRDENVSV